MRILLAIAALATACSTFAQGNSQAILGYTNAITGLFTNTTGWTFQPAATLTVTGLGVFTNFFAHNPVSEVQVGLWSSGGALLASNSITPASTLVDQSRYESVSQVALVSGQTYYVGVYLFGNLFGLDVATPTVNDGLVFHSSDISALGTAGGNGGFAAPTSESPIANAAYLGPNFQYQGGVPEPASTLLLALGALLLAARTRLFPRQYR